MISRVIEQGKVDLVEAENDINAQDQNQIQENEVIKKEHEEYSDSEKLVRIDCNGGSSFDEDLLIFQIPDEEDALDLSRNPCSVSTKLNSVVL